MSGPPNGQAGAPSRLRAAVYTRKSSEEGLDQDYNSLHAQRDACEAYVRSQIGEGWSALPTQYDDGGFSGGNMDRPGLAKLMADVDARRIDIVVVYKVDRLTRSLADFAKIVERFDAAGVSFVSVTQAFNTTTSMGRLTLNVLLSFAQFEREVTGERIRDKIAASKAKGMWMGGNVPLGYDPSGRTLTVNEPEADQVRHIFRRYLELGSVHVLRDELDAQGQRSKRWTSRAGKEIGGAPFGRGALFHLLSNRHYLGEIVHKDLCHPGLHPPIVDRSLFNAVQLKLARNGGAERRVKAGLQVRPRTAPLAGLVFDDAGNSMTSVSARKGKGRRAYRYYVSAALQRGRRDQAGSLARFPGPALEDLLRSRLAELGILRGGEALAAAVERVEVGRRKVVVRLSAGLRLPSAVPLGEGESSRIDDDCVVLVLPGTLRWRGGSKMAVGPNGAPATKVCRIDLPLLKALVRAEAWKARLQAGESGTIAELAQSENADDQYVRVILRLGFLDPSIKRSILEGSQDSAMSLTGWLAKGVPLAWADQHPRQLLSL